MSLSPLLEAAPAIPLHAFAAMAAFVLGLVQFALPKGTLPHRTIGFIWVGLMLLVAGSSFWIRLWNRFHGPGHGFQPKKYSNGLSVSTTAAPAIPLSVARRVPGRATPAESAIAHGKRKGVLA